MLLKRVALGLAVAAVVSPAAQAARGGSVPQLTDARHAALLVPKHHTLAIGGPRMVIGGSQANEGVRAPRGVAPVRVPVSFGQQSSNIDWSDAGIGAGLAVALVLLGAGGAAATRQTRRPATV